MSGGGQAGLAGPHYSTAGWQEDHHGVPPVEMLARIANMLNGRPLRVSTLLA